MLAVVLCNTALCRVVSNKYGEIAVAILTGEMLNITNKNSQPPSRVTSATLSISETFSDNQLVSVASRGAFCKNRPRSERRLLVLLVAAILLSTALIIALAVLSFYYSRHGTKAPLCDSIACIRSASSLLQSMDRTVNPCEDFYKYTCGNWADEHPTPETAIENNWFSERTRNVMRRIRAHLKKNASDSEPLPVTQARVIYKSCMDTEELDSQGLEPMFQVLRDIGMQVRPSLQNETTQEPFNLVSVAVRTKRLVYQDLLVGFSIAPQSTNRTIMRLTLGTPTVRSPLPGYRDAEKRIEKRRRKEKRSKGDDGEEDTYAGAYLVYLVKAISYVYRWNNTAWKGKDAEMAVKNAALRILELDERLTEVMNENDEADGDAIEMSVEELQMLTNDNLNGSLQWNWTEYLTLMFEGTENVTLDLEGEDKIMVTNVNYLSSLVKLLSETPMKTLELTLWWEVVHVLAPQTNRDLRQMKEDYIETVMGGRAPETRSMFCTNSVNYLMGMAVSYFIADAQFLNTTKSKVEDMIENIQWAFSTLVRSADWMDADTKIATLDKAAAVKQFVGFPEWLLDKDELKNYYEGVQVNETTYLLNMLNIVGMFTTTMLQNLRKPNEDGWASDPTDVNAFHTFQANAITVPSGILQFPFYGLGLEALNYGAIGTILGHELTHGFDNSGRQYDRNGNMRQWWTNATVDEYVNRTACFVEQYSSYQLEEIGGWVNGRLTLGENIADNGGLRESLRAYRRYRQRNGPEAVLPGFEAFSEEQLFFLSFAHVWCENWSKDSLYWSKDDEHSPNHIRVLGVLSNSPEFSAVWECPKGSKMNPERERCKIW